MIRLNGGCSVLTIFYLRRWRKVLDCFASTGNMDQYHIPPLILSGVCFVVSIISLMLQYPVSGFEHSIYAGLGLVFWVPFLVGLTAAGIGTALSIIANGDFRRGMLFVSLYLAVLLSLPLLRGYLMYGRGTNDITAHWGYTKTILQTGHIPSEDWYPFIHLQFTVLSRIGADRQLVFTIVAILYNLFFGAGAYLYVREITNSRRVAAFAALAVLVPIYGVYHRSLHPFMLSFMLFPIVLFVYHRAHKQSEATTWTTLLILLLSSILFFHPFTFIYVWVWLSITVFVYKIRGLVAGSSSQKNGWTADATPTLSLFPVALVSFGYWYFAASSRIVYPLLQFQAALLGESTTTGSEQVEAAQGLDPTSLVINFVDLYGAAFLFIAVAGGIAVVVVGQWLYDWGDVTIGGLADVHLTPSVQVLAGGGLAIGLLLTGLFVRPTRVAQYGLFASAILIGSVAGWYAISSNGPSRTKTHRFITVAAVVAILFALPLGALNVYTPNRHLTAQENVGSEWVLDANQGPMQRTASLGDNYKSVLFQKGHHQINRYKPFTAPFPASLGYNNSSHAGRSYNGPRLIITKQVDRYLPGKGYSQQDYVRLDGDSAIAKIYSNGLYEVWRVPASNKDT